MTLAPDERLFDCLTRHKSASPNVTAFGFEKNSISFSAFEQRTNKIAHALAAAGIGAGERVAYIGKNTTAYFELFYGAMKAGVVATPINWRLALPEMAAIIADARARLIVLGREFVGEPDLLNLPDLRIVLAAEGGAAKLTGFNTWFAEAPDHSPNVRISSADVALQLYTSGTTGVPKGVMLTHANFTSGLAASASHDLGWNRWTGNDRSLLAMPVSHVSGTGWGILSMYHGAACHIQRQFDLDLTFDMLARDRISRLFLVPAALQMLARHPRARSADYTTLHEICYGASPMPLPLLRECMDVMGRPFVQFYGMTETAGTVVSMQAADHQAALDDPGKRHILRAAGRALPWVDLRVVDPAGADAAPGQVGEIVTRSSANMAGYWNKPKETARTIDSDGWLHTGDAGYVDADGFIFIHDRMKDMIISGGENVYPAEVESALAEHPAVAEAAVIGVPDDRWGESVKAIIVLRPDMQLSAEELISWSRTRIAGFKAPGSVDFVDVLPRNSSGKLLKRALRAPYWEGRERQV